MPAAKKAAPRKAAPRKAAARTAPQADPTPDPSAVYAALYPTGAELWWYTTKNGTRIPFPRFASLEQPTRALWRRLYGLDEVFQAFEWMKWAGVPEPVQALTDNLDEGEYKSMFEAWFAGADLSSGE